jgi:hypothetical protein
MAMEVRYQTMKRLCSIIFLSLAIISGCTKLDPGITSRDHAETDVVKTPETTRNELITPTLQPKTSTPTPIEYKTPVPSVNPSAPILVDERQIDAFWWSTDSQMISYTIWTNTGQELWAFDINNRESHFVSQYTQETLDLPNELLSQKEHIVYWSLSPSHDLLIYAIRLAPTLTPPPDSGEFWVLTGPVNLFLLDTNSQENYPLGTIEHCIDRIVWAGSEHTAVIVPAIPPAPCDHPQFWLIDLVARQLKPITSEVIVDDDVDIYSFSPGGGFLLLRDNYHLYLFEVGTRKVRDIPSIYSFSDGTWITDDSLLVRYWEDRNSPIFIGLFNLDTLEIERILDPNQLFEPTEDVIGIARMSPDGKWIAYIRENISDYSRSLWVYPLK